ncbi:hypothetical protein GUITHDRAFT_58154, partial [Guillardia theta CCMP2712]
ERISHIYFTSGSTGFPKGCVVGETALLRYCRARNEVFEFSSSSSCLLASPHTFDPCLGDIFSTWMAGGVLCVASKRTILSSLGKCLQEFRASHLLTTPTLFLSLHGSLGPADLQDLRVVALGGESMRQSLVEEWGEEVLLLNVYGVTECAVYQSCSRMRRGGDTKSIGRAIGDNMLLLVAGDGSDPSHLVEEGSGEEGEIWIAGPQVGLGYLLLPELTQERFVPHPTLGPCFRTGDIACATAGGWSLRGRRDCQVKI